MPLPELFVRGAVVEHGVVCQLWGPITDHYTTDFWLASTLHRAIIFAGQLRKQEKTGLNDNYRDQLLSCNGLTQQHTGN